MTPNRRNSPLRLLESTLAAWLDTIDLERRMSVSVLVTAPHEPAPPTEPTAAAPRLWDVAFVVHAEAPAAEEARLVAELCGAIGDDPTFGGTIATMIPRGTDGATTHTSGRGAIIRLSVAPER